MLSAHQPLERFPDADQAGGARGRRASRSSRAACRRCATASPRASPAWSCRCSARRDRDGDRRGAHPRHVRRRALPRRLRQDRAGPADRRAELRPPAGDLRARRADDHPACPNGEKARIRQLYAEGKVGREELLEAESAVLPRARHLHLLRHRQHQPDADGDHGPAPAGRRLRQPEHAAARRADRARPPGACTEITALGNEYTPVGEIVDERAVVNGIVGLLATGGSTNHTHPPRRHGARRRHPARLGRLRRRCRRSCRCCAASTRTASPT